MEGRQKYIEAVDSRRRGDGVVRMKMRLVESCSWLRAGVKARICFLGGSLGAFPNRDTALNRRSSFLATVY